MTNLESLKKKIIEDANAQAALIKKEAEQKKERMIKDKEEMAIREEKQILHKAKQNAQLAKERTISRAKLQARDEKLQAKQEVIEKVFHLAKDHLRNIHHEQYIDFLQKQLETKTWKGTELLIVPEKYVPHVQKLNLPIEISNEEFVDSGFLIKDGNIVTNYSFDALIDFYRDELEPEIARILFAGLE